MNCSTWNVRRLSAASKSTSIGAWLRSNKVCLVALLKTRGKGYQIDKTASSIEKG